MKTVGFNDLKTSDLYLNCTYQSKSGKLEDETIGVMFPVGNRGGFRKSLYKKNAELVNFVILHLTSAEPDWPDEFSDDGKKLVYYGDSSASEEILKTKRGGNRFLSLIFERLETENRSNIPPIFVFQSVPAKRDVVFKGLAVPSADPDSLVVQKKIKNGMNVNNYKAVFDILDLDIVPRAWINDLLNNTRFTENTPNEYKEWVTLGKLTSVKRLVDTIVEQELIAPQGDFDSNVFSGDTEIDVDQYEGNRKLVLTNKYERSTIARQKCIERYGPICQACGLDFEKLYGELGKGFIHVHHVVPMNEIGENYKVDYKKDLIPVCPNCHAMLHRKLDGKNVSVAQLRRIIKRHNLKSKSGGEQNDID